MRRVDGTKVLALTRGDLAATLVKPATPVERPDWTDWVEGTPHGVPAPVVAGRAVFPHPAAPMLALSREAKRA